MIVSIFFLIITLLIYIIVPELRSLHAKNLMCYCLSLIIFYTGLSLLNILDLLKINFSKICGELGYTIYFSGLSTFCWINILCFEIFSTISRDTIRSTTGLKRFLMYCSYGFGLPILMTIFVILIDRTSIFNFIPPEYRPFIGLSRVPDLPMECFLSGKTNFYLTYDPSHSKFFN
jgi:hypothetical protein